MHLSRLEIFGFKSFANKLDLRMDDGITAVVGPNGCGKTNIVDAIRWVLGEQRPRFLRGDRMEDVIFNGSERREPVGMAEVSLTIENTKGMLPIEYNEVTVTRRLFRSGESAYLINRTPCRLMDIENLLMDTGIGPHSYSVIEQGMVDAIISENPEDRRKLFEEAAGITKYKARRKSALQRLSATEEDLLRIGDIIGEVERQVGSLGRQVRKAERYQTYRKQLRDLDIRTARFRFGRLHREIEPLLDNSKTSKKKLEGLTVALRKKEAENEKLRLELIALEKEVGEKDVRIREIDRALHQRGEEMAVWRERIGALKNLIARSEAEQKRIQAHLAEARIERDSAQKNEAEAAQILSERVRKANILEKALEQLEQRVEEKRNALDRKRKEVADLFGLHVRKTSEQQRRKSQLNGFRTRLGELAKEREGLESERNRIHERQEEVEERIAHLEERLSEEQGQRARLAGERTENENRLRGLHRNRDSLEAEQRAGEEQLEFWRRMRETYEGYSESVRSLLLDSPVAGQIRGVIGDLIDADEPFAPAIEHALGPLLQALVVEDTRTVRHALKFLDNAHAGRTIFLPLDRIVEPTSRSVPTQERGNERKGVNRIGESDSSQSDEKQLNQAPGVLGLVADLVRCDENIVPIVRVLFKNTLMVDTLEHALTLSENGNGSWDVITLKGENVSSQGRIVGGAGKGERKELLLGRSRRIETIKKSLMTKSDQLEAILRDISLIQEEIEKQSAARLLIDEKIERTGREVLLLEQRKAQEDFEEKRLSERSASLDGE
ncbi:MAG: AAA family ATPase, partial [Candidatus Latescibacteria bacterium]|nr:AAA family ATPase [Candidatus Latescibacterota bacterium]